jgi:flagellar basal-body rod protein FlgB
MGLVNSDALVDLLGAADRSHAVLANNIANLNTPGFRSQRVKFAQQLDAILSESGDLKDGKALRTEVYEPGFPDVGLDGNDVILEREIVELNKNALKMRFYLAVLGSRIRRVRSAIDGR